LLLLGTAAHCHRPREQYLLLAYRMLWSLLLLLLLFLLGTVPMAHCHRPHQQHMVQPSVYLQEQHGQHMTLLLAK
jgi:hypothetical protein